MLFLSALKIIGRHNITFLRMANTFAVTYTADTGPVSWFRQTKAQRGIWEGSTEAVFRQRLPLHHLNLLHKGADLCRMHKRTMTLRRRKVAVEVERQRSSGA